MSGQYFDALTMVGKVGGDWLKRRKGAEEMTHVLMALTDDWCVAGYYAPAFLKPVGWSRAKIYTSMEDAVSDHQNGILPVGYIWLVVSTLSGYDLKKGGTK